MAGCKPGGQEGSQETKVVVAGEGRASELRMEQWDQMEGVLQESYQGDGMA